MSPFEDFLAVLDENASVVIPDVARQGCLSVTEVLGTLGWWKLRQEQISILEGNDHNE